MKKLTKDQAIVVSGYTGIMICKLTDLHQEVERRVGRPVMLHEMGRRGFWNIIKASFKEDFLSLFPEDEA